MDNEQKKRANKITKGTISVLFIGLVYYLFTQLTGKGIPCLIKLITKKYFPGCGISRMFISLLHGDMRAAASYNLLLMVLLIPGLFFALRRAFLYVFYDIEKGDRAENIFIFIVFVLTIIFWIIRNTTAFSFLAPGGFDLRIVF